MWVTLKRRQKINKTHVTYFLRFILLPIGSYSQHLCATHILLNEYFKIFIVFLPFATTEYISKLHLQASISQTSYRLLTIVANKADNILCRIIYSE